MSKSGSRAAAATTGTFTELPLAHVLVYVRAKRLSGVLDIRAGEQRHGWVVFWRGQVVSVTTTPTMARFGAVVYDLGLLDAKRLEETTLTAAREKRPQADILVERGIISPAQYVEVLEEQMRRRVHHLFSFPRTTLFLFREGRTSANAPASLIDVLAPVWRGIKDYPPRERVLEVLTTIGSRPLAMVSEARLELAELSGAEAHTVELIATRPMTLHELRGASSMPPERVDLLAYLLVIARCVEPIGEGKMPAASGQLWPATKVERLDSGLTSVAQQAAPTVATAPPKVRGPADLGIDAIKSRAALLETESPFEALGIPDNATVEAARAAFFRLSRVWHPDRLPRELDVVRSEVARIFAHMSDAHRLLTDARGHAAGS